MLGGGGGTIVLPLVAGGAFSSTNHIPIRAKRYACSLSGFSARNALAMVTSPLPVALMACLAEAASVT